MPLLQEHVGYPVIARVDEEALHSADLAIDGMDLVPRPYLVVTKRNNVLDHSPRVFWHWHVADVDKPARAHGFVCFAAALRRSACHVIRFDREVSNDPEPRRSRLGIPGVAVIVRSLAWLIARQLHGAARCRDGRRLGSRARTHAWRDGRTLS
jgi:hypothetical protein